MDTTLAQGPGVGQSLEALAMAPPEKRKGIVRSMLGEVYGNPVRNTMWEYALTPWNISNYSKGFHWKGVFGFRGFARNQTGWSAFAALPTTAARQLVAGLGYGAGKLFGHHKGTMDFFSAFGKSGLEGIANIYKPGGTAANVWRGLGLALGGSDTMLGTLGSDNFGNIDWKMFGGINTANKKYIAEGLQKIGKKYQGYGTLAGANTQKIADEIIDLAGGRALAPLELVEKGGASKMAGKFVSGMRASRLMGAYATAALIWDVGKYAAKGTYKITRYALENITSAASSAAKQEWGNYAPVAMMTAGAVTERQRALDEIQRSSMNARSLIGNEASMAARTFAGGRVW